MRSRWLCASSAALSTAAALLAGCAGDGGSRSGALVEAAVFLDETVTSGLAFSHFNGRSGLLLLAEITCGGGALLDYDGDGDLDVFLAQGTMLGSGRTLADATVPLEHDSTSGRLYRNEHNGIAGAPLRFTDVTAESGIATRGYGCGATSGDFDNDGRADLLVLNLGVNELWRNRGDGTFEEVGGAAGLGAFGNTTTAVVWDYDRDGSLDLYVGNYVQFDNESPSPCRALSGAIDYCGPGAYPYEADRLYRNRGDGTFEDVSASSGIGAGALPALGSVAVDVDGDDRLDLYVANDGEPNRLFVQQADGGFVEQALASGCALGASGEMEAGMGTDSADFDRDGDFDLFVVHLVKETNTLYLNDGAGGFFDATRGAGLAAPSMPFTSFGAGFLDADLDGWEDLLVVNGAVTIVPELERLGDPFPLHQPNQLFRNIGGGRFVDWTDAGGEALARSEVSRGALLGDLDDDGDPDVVVFNNGGAARLLRNQVGQRSRWIGVRLLTGSSSRDALGARATLLDAAGRRLGTRRAGTDGSFASGRDPRVVFGLGADEPLSPIVEVRWPSGAVERFRDLAVGGYTPLHEGSGEATAPGAAE